MSNGTSGSGSKSGTTVVTKVTGQGGVEIDLSNNPLKYGEKAPITASQRKTVEEFEQKRLKSKIEYSRVVRSDGTAAGDDTRGGSGSVRTPWSKISQGEILSHNHPRSGDEVGMLGGTFSEGDIKMFNNVGKLGGGLQYLRASAAEGTYSIGRTDSFDGDGLLRGYRSAIKGFTDAYRGRMKGINTGTWEEYSKAVNDSFNTMLVDMHNWLLANQSTYGYTYTLERRG